MPASARSSSLNFRNLSALGFAFLAIGVLFSPLFIAVGVGFLGMAVASRPGRKVAGHGVVALAVILLLFQLGYGIGKDMAQRENANQAAADTDAA
jgi:multisubunit Na+/H+ antiporter MnhC subunit